MPEAQAHEERGVEEPYLSQRRRLRRRHLLLGGAAILLLLGLLYGGYLYWQSTRYESTDDAFIEGHVIPISPRVAGQVTRVLIDDNQRVARGELLVEIDPRDFRNVVAQDQAALEAARSQARQAALNVELTSVTSTAGVAQATYGVEQGSSTISAAQAQLGTARGQVAQAEANLNSAKAALAQALARVAEQRAVVERANNDRTRYEQLFKDDVVSAEQRDLFVTTAIAANASLTALQKSADAAEAQIGQAGAALQTALETQRAAQAQVGAAQAVRGQATGRLREVNVTSQRVALSLSALEAAEAEVKRLDAATSQALLNLSYTQIIAPEAGRITRKAVEPGMYLQIGQPLFSIVQPDVWVVANFKETQLTQMRPGQPVTVEVDAYPDRVFHAHVDSIQKGTGARFSLFPPENATGNYIKVVQRVPVKIVFDEPLENIRLLAPGMSVVPRVKIK